ncbi:MAG TPA: DUF2203 domain-containing protein [Gemmatimonadaceae bacterium]
MTRLFTVDQANRMLPLVSRIVRDIVETHRVWQLTIQEFELATAESRADRPSLRADSMQREAQRLAREIQGFMGELRELGVEFKGFDLGLVDFPSERDGRLVYLCWKLGEDAVAWWHELEDGYRGRQPLVPMVEVL